VSEQSGGIVYQVDFITPPIALSALAAGPSPEAHETLCVVANVMRRIAGDEKPLLCLTCDHAFVDDPPPIIAVVKPFASIVGTVIASPVCSTCAAKGQEAVFADAIERFRADGMADCREIMVGTA
jgi:hypothetical protein